MVADYKKGDIPQIVLEVELVMKESMYGFNENKKTPFLKVLSAVEFIGSG